MSAPRPTQEGGRPDGTRGVMEEREEEEDGEDYDAPRSSQEGSTNRKESEKAGRDSDEEEVSENDEEPSEWQLNSPKNISPLISICLGSAMPCRVSVYNPHSTRITPSVTAPKPPTVCACQHR